MMRMFAPSPPADAREAAVWWATRAQMDPVAHGADANFKRWHDLDPAHAAAWAEMAQTVEAVGAYAASPELRAMRDAALEVVRVRRPRSPRRYWIGASVMTASLAAIAILLMQPFDRRGMSAASQRFITAVGERRDVRLSDGSRITLNTASILEVAYTGGRRDVRLIAGQALFQVARDPLRPFVVEAGNRRIVAIGTAFDVKVDGEGAVRVLLVEGRVDVEPVRPSGLLRLIPALARDTLDPGQQLLVASASESPQIAAADVEQVTAWSRGQLVFRRDPLVRALEEINRYSTTQIALADQGLAQLRISGVFPAAQSEDFLAAIQTLYPVAVERRTGSLVILDWRKK